MPLPEGRAATVKAPSMTELVAGLTALGFSSPSWDKTVIQHWDSRLAGNWGPYSQANCDALTDELATVRRVAQVVHGPGGSGATHSQATYHGPCLESDDNLDPQAGAYDYSDGPPTDLNQ